MNQKPKNDEMIGRERPEDMIRVDGRGQILDMLRAADPAFRELILKRLEKRDPRLARALRAEL